MTSKKGGKRKNNPKEGLFDDLQDLSESEISEKISAMKAGIDAGEKELPVSYTHLTLPTKA